MERIKLRSGHTVSNRAASKLLPVHSGPECRGNTWVNAGEGGLSWALELTSGVYRSSGLPRGGPTGLDTILMLPRLASGQIA